MNNYIIGASKNSMDNDYFIEYYIKTKSPKGPPTNIDRYDTDITFTTKVVSACNAVEAVNIVEGGHECYTLITNIRKI